MAESELQKTPAWQMHVDLGGKMVPFAGWSMPVQYESIMKEVNAVRNTAGVFDVSHMGEFWVEGKDAVAYLQYIMTNDLNLLVDGKSQYANICYPNGTVVDDCFLYQVTPEKIRVVVNASNTAKDFQWMKEHIGSFDITFTDISPTIARFAYQGPKTEELLNPIVEADLSAVKRFFNLTTTLKTAEGPIEVFMARTGYTGEDGFEVTSAAEDGEALFKALLDTGAAPAGLGARDTCRLEACYSLYGHELSDRITPIEANIGFAIKKKEGIDYIGKEVLLKQKVEGTARIVVGLNLVDKGILRENYQILKDGQEIGYVTSGGYSPTLKKTIGLGLIKREFKGLGTEVMVDIRSKLKRAVVVKIPFLSN